MNLKKIFFISLLSSVPFTAMANMSVKMHFVHKDGTGDNIGKIIITESPEGLVFTPKLKGLAAGLHGFHVHQNPDCGAKMSDGKMVAGEAAGGHFDPENAEHHGTPWGDGHKGDLPALYVDREGKASHPVLAPKLTLSDLKGHSLMIHAGGDNYSDKPEELGGGGDRVACGVMQ